MLIDDCQQLSKLAKNFTDHKSNVEELKNFKTRQIDIEQIEKDLNSLVESLQTFKDKGIYGFTLMQEVDDFLSQVIDIEKQFKTDHKSLLEPKRIKTLEVKSKTLRAAITRQLSQMWIAYRNSHVPTIDKKFLSALEMIPNFSKTVVQVEKLSSQIEAIDYPKNHDQFEKSEDIIAQLITAWSSLNSDEVPTEVLRFLKEATTTNGAPMNLLTPTVQQWLDAKGIGSSFRIRLGN